MRPALTWLLLCLAMSAAAAGGAVLVWRRWSPGVSDLPVGNPALAWWRWVLPCLHACAWCARPWAAGGPGQSRRQRWLIRADLDHLLDSVLLGSAQCLLAACAGTATWLAMPGRSVAAIASVSAAWVAWCWPYAWVKARARRRAERMVADMPVFLDMLALGMAGGQHFNAALQQVLQHLPAGCLRDALMHTWTEIRQGRPRVEAMRALGGRSGVVPLQRLAAAVAQAETLGMALAPLLRAQSQQCQAERLQLAERLALEAPVKMLLPLVLCLLPATFLILAYPVLYYLQGGDGV